MTNKKPLRDFLKSLSICCLVAATHARAAQIFPRNKTKRRDGFFVKLQFVSDR
jgi:hypothetical protein